MDTEILTHDNPHLLGESATHPSEPRYVTLAALLRLAGGSYGERRGCNVVL